jgi:glycosyltransferase involved in cell wall biosynthesis
MRIIRLSTFLDYGGIESKMVNLSTYSDENEWWFCAIGKGGDAEKKIEKNNKIVKCLKLSVKIPSFISIVRLYLYFKKHKPHVVHSSGAEANFHGAIAARLAGIKIIVSEEIGIPNHTWKAILLFKWIYNMSDFVVGESQTVMNYLKENYNIREDKLKVISNFTLFSDLEKQEPKSVTEPFTIVSISRLEPVKNIEGVIKVVHLLKQKQFKIKYIIVGDGRSRNSIQNLIKDLNLQDEIKLVGYQNDPKKFLTQADLYVLNSLTEGFSNSLLEAMYSKIPSISTDVGAAKEMIEDGISGWIVKTDNEMELFEKIKSVIQSEKSTRIQIGSNGHNHVVKTYSLESHVQSLLKLYKS